MNTETIKTRRNPTVEILRFLAAISVVILHVGFPGPVGAITNCLTRFAVPFFFAVTGYYHCGAEKETIERHQRSIASLAVLATLGYALWMAATGQRSLIPNWKELAIWVFFQEEPYAGHLWYLAAVSLCYQLLSAYVSKVKGSHKSYRPLYKVGGVLFFLYLIPGAALDLLGIDLPNWIYRNGYLTGIPMFLMGMAVAEYRNRLKRKFSVFAQTEIAVLGIAASVAQFYFVGRTEIPLGMFLTVPALLLLATEHPMKLREKQQKITGRLGKLSTSVYIIHMFFHNLWFLRCAQPVRNLLGDGEEWLRPFAVIAASLLTALAWEAVKKPKERK